MDVDAGRDDTVIGRRVAQLRAQRSWSQTDLAREAGLRQGYVSLVEGGHRTPGAIVLSKLAHALGVGVDDILRTSRPGAGSTP